MAVTMSRWCLKTTSVSRWRLEIRFVCWCWRLNPAWSSSELLTLVTPVSNYTPTSTNIAAERSRYLEKSIAMGVQHGLIIMFGSVGDAENCELWHLFVCTLWTGVWACGHFLIQTASVWKYKLNQSGSCDLNWENQQTDVTIWTFCIRAIDFKKYIHVCIYVLLTWACSSPVI